MPADRRIAIATTSLLMEGARRIDEWSRIADVIAGLDVIPEFAPVDVDREGPTLDLLPHEWQILAMIDHARNLREIAAALRQDEFQVAKIAYGLATTGVITVRAAAPLHPTPPTASEARAHLALGFQLARRGDLAGARASWEKFLGLVPAGQEAERARAAIDAVTRLHNLLEPDLDE